MNDTSREPQRQKILRRILYFLTLAIIIGLVIFIPRGPHISNTLKRIILPELEDALGHRVIANKIYINIFPLFIEAKTLKVFDEDGTRILIANRVKGYIELSGLLNRHLSIRRLVINEPDISTNREQLDEIIKSVKTYLEKERKTALKVKIKVIEVVNGIVSLRDNDLKGKVDIKGLAGELIIGEKPRIMASIKEFSIKREGWPEIKGDLKTSTVIKNERIEIKNFEIGSYGSTLKGAGLLSEGKGNLKTDIALIVDSVKRIFSLTQKGDGRISAKGDIKFEGIHQLKNTFLDLKLDGDFYLQTLMELLKVKERVEGFVDFQGEIIGRLSDISGKAQATLRKGNLFGVDIDSVSCDVLYHDGVMKFENGAALLYNGEARANASLNLPGAEFFTVNIKFDSIDSPAALKLIGWEPEIPAGKVYGELSTSGSEFDPDGWFVYKAIHSQHLTDNVLSRIKDIKGNYSMRGDVLSLSDMQLSTSSSKLSVNGKVNIKEKTLNLNSGLITDNVLDLTQPYYKGAKGHGKFSGEITGSFSNPKVSGKANISNVSIENYMIEDFSSSFSYEKNLLDIHESILKSPGEEHIIKGKIFFPEAKEIFDLSMPVYNLSASLKNAEFGHVMHIFYKDFVAQGKVDGEIRVGGSYKDIDISGNAVARNASLYKIPFDSASAAFSFEKKRLSLKKLRIVRGRSILNGEGSLLPDERFSYSASSDKLYIKDLGLERLPDDAVLSLESEGHGTFDNPVITVSATVAGGTFKGKNLGSGTINAAIANKDITLNAALFNKKMRLKGNGRLEGKLSWNAELDIQQGRYDFIISSVLKDVPEDLELYLQGHATMEGDRKNIAVSAGIDHLKLSLFGQTFSNESRMDFSVSNRKLSFGALSIKSGATSFKIRGGLEFGKGYDISLDGSSSLSPLKGLSKKIGFLSGDTNFVFSISGKWEKPKINGGMNIYNASFGLRDYSTYASSVNGYLYIDEDRIVVQKLSGKIGGGDMAISGVVYLKAFDIKRFYLEAKLDDVTTLISKDFSMNFGGDLLYRGTMDTQSISGDIKINRARYREMVEWRTWLLTSTATEKPKAEVSKLQRTELNIEVSRSDNIYIDNNIVRTSLSVNGVLRGTILRPVLLGRVETKEGVVFFRNNEFKIIHASADFVDPNRINPILELTAETTISGYKIRLNLEGKMGHFNLSLSSDPHLADMDILSLLTTGQVGKQLKGIEGGIGAGEATSFVTGKLQDVLEERMRSITGLDRFMVQPYVSKITGTVEPGVTVSKRLVGDNLIVTYTSVLGSAPEQIIKLEYLLNKNVSLVGTRDEIGGIGGDIQFRFEFK